MYDEIDHRREGECHKVGGGYVSKEEVCDIGDAAWSISGIGVSV